MTTEPQTAPAAPKPRELAFTPVIFLGDLLLRWTALGFWRLHLISTTWLWVIQLTGIPIILIIVCITRDTKIRRLHAIPAGVTVFPRDTPSSLTWMLVTGLIGLAQIYSATRVNTPWLRYLTIAIVTILYAMYVLILYVASVKSDREEPSENSLEIWHDANDRLIIRLETERASMAQRVDTYTLESALFGALAFSSFVTIVSSDKAKLKGVVELFRDLGDAIRSLITLSPADLLHVAAKFADENTFEATLLAAIAALTLMCSTFFLSVIICRVRFNDLIARADYCIRIASQFNAKEEEILNLTLGYGDATPAKFTERLNALKENIGEAMTFASESMTALTPIVRYMSFFRNLGVLTFLTILVTSAFWISPILALMFGGLSVIAFAYPTVDRWMRDRTVRHILQFLKGSRRLIQRVHGQSSAAEPENPV
ncbi:MAG TPA: hypothetical protein VGQ21_01665 [Thermoanaerobaculia bacterium]|jgi:hypothetical protein|nr:hypothetical protein [Thermoanaerobaculia bacterium]